MPLDVKQQQEDIMNNFQLIEYPFLNSLYEHSLQQHILNDYKPNYISILNGKKILDNESEIVSYLAYYSVHHIAKLKFACNNLDKIKFDSRKLEIIDWGCGQGLASLFFLDYLKRKHGNYEMIKSITLIEPSKISLEVANRFLDQYMSNVNGIKPQIKLIQSDFDSLNVKGIAFTKDSLKVHLFCNVLDLLSYDVNKLSEQVSKLLIGENLFICLGPNYSQNVGRTRGFIHGLKNTNAINVISDKGLMIPALFYHINSCSYKIDNVKSSEDIFIINN